MNIRIPFEVNEAIEFVLGRETRSGPVLVLRNPATQIVRDPNIERLRTIAQDVNEILLRRNLVHGSFDCIRGLASGPTDFAQDDTAVDVTRSQFRIL